MSLSPTPPQPFMSTYPFISISPPPISPPGGQPLTLTPHWAWNSPSETQTTVGGLSPGGRGGAGRGCHGCGSGGDDV